jgi:hypothetical protein
MVCTSIRFRLRERCAPPSFSLAQPRLLMLDITTIRHRTQRIMQFYRLYAGADGQSHFEPLDSSKTSEFFNKTRDAKGLLFRNDFSTHIVDYHPAPHRRWVITLAGSVEIGVGNGTRRIFYPGDVFLAEDTTGQGHTATPRDWVRAYVDLEPAKMKDR